VSGDISRDRQAAAVIQIMPVSAWMGLKVL
jgi:hypothetical protein